MSDKNISKLEQEVQELRVVNEWLRNTIGKRDDRIQSLIKLGLKTTRPNWLAEWKDEEEL